VDVLVVAALKIEYEATRAAGSGGYANNPGVSSWTDQGTDTTVPYILVAVIRDLLEAAQGVERPANSSVTP
jgi:hypothetical protein